MQSITECYKKVSKDCFKFIRSQETTKEKFKNKEKMIKSFLIPISFWINNRTNKSKPYLIGLAGGQGTGKTTISSILKIILTKYFKLNVFKISIDDLYKTGFHILFTIADNENKKYLKDPDIYKGEIDLNIPKSYNDYESYNLY